MTTKHSFTIEEYEEMLDENMGFCTDCGDFQCCCEPDARECKCESCGERSVYGLDECLIMGLVH